MDNTCVICKNKVATKKTEYCRSCVRRVMTWGRNGATKIIELSSGGDIPIEEAKEFCKEYYIGKCTRSFERVDILKTGLCLLGWKGKIIGRHRIYDDYFHNRAANISYLLRNHERKEACELCGSTDELHLHHIVPCKWGGVNFAPLETITLCKKCHLEIHKRLKEVLSKEYLISILDMHRNEIIRHAKSVL